MRLSALNLSLSSRALFAKRAFAASASPLPLAPVPINAEVIVFGDSRTEDGVGSAVSQTNGYSFGTQNIGYAGWLHALSGNRLRLGQYPNFGISASSLQQMAQEPRLDALGNVGTGRWDRPNSSSGYSTNKSASSAGAHGAGIVMILAGTNWPSGTVSDQLGYLETIMNNIGPSKVIVLLNETPRGVDYTGASQNAASNAADRYAFAQQMLKYDFGSGDAKARANVIVVNTYDEFLDTGSGTSYLNKRGYLRDGLHDTPYGSMRKAQVVIDRLATVWGASWDAMPRQLVLPTKDGLTTAAASQPFIHTNPILTPGSAGQVLGTWGTAPAAANVPQGWAVNAQANGSGLIAAAEKGVETDPDGYPVFKLTLSGTLAANTNAIVQVYQTLASSALAAALSAGNVSINDKLRMVGNIKVDPGSAFLQGVGLRLTAQDSTASRTIAAKAMTGASNGVGASLNAYLDTGGVWRTLMTELVDCQDPNLVAQGQNIASFTQIQGIVEIMLTNTTAAAQNVSAVIRMSRTGVWRTSN